MSAPSTVDLPRTAQDVATIIQSAVIDGTPLELVGAKTKRGLGRPSQAARELDLSGLSGITVYEPEELVLTALPGTPLAEIEAELARHSQQLAFEPPDLGPLLGSPAESQTIGGVVSCNLAGSRRIKAGAARDHFLGFQAVNGRGEAFKAGGRVVKNVTGYDLPKLLAGSYGTLAVLTEVTLKVLPAPETTRTLLLFGLDDAAALAALSEALQSPAEVSGAAHLPAAIAARSGIESLRWTRTAVTAVRIEGFAPSVAARATFLKDALGRHGEMDLADDQVSAALWREIGEVAPYAGAAERLVWKLSIPPSAGAATVEAIRRAVPAEAYYDWGGGLVWLFVDRHDEADTAIIRDMVGATGGHATLIRAPEAVRAATPVFHPQAEALAALSKRVKDSFDPHRILNPGRMYAGV